MSGFHYTNAQFALLLFSILLIAIASFHFQFSEKRRTSIIILLIGVLGLRIFDAVLDPFLNYWDEQFHALVAKNLSHDFIKPVLYPKDLVAYNYKQWTGNYIWVHKQPFFLWQMALSIKLFGASVFAVRLPSVLCIVFTTYCIYRIGKNLANEYIGFYGAVFFSFSFYISEFVSGSTATDHNDAAFITYVTASIWAFSEFLLDPKKRKWIYLIGIFSGIAILNKWLVGLVVYSGWGLYILVSEQEHGLFNYKRYKDVFTSLIITILIAAPWQIYCLLRFPVETKYEMAYNSKHLLEPVEGHGGDAYFYFDNLFYTYGKFSPLFILFGIVLLYSFFKEKKNYLYMFFIFFITYLFYTIVATKMYGFTMIVSFFIFLGFGAVLYYLSTQLKARTAKILIPSIMLIAGVLSLRSEEKQTWHTKWRKNPIAYYNRKNQIYWKDFSQKLDSLMPNKNTVLFNCSDIQGIKLMFYSDYIGYWGFPNDEQKESLKQKGYNIAIYDNGNLDPWVYNQKDYFVVSDKSRKTVKTDTVLIKASTLNNIHLNWDSRISCEQPSNGEPFIMRTYMDGSCSFRTLSGNFLSAGTALYGDLFCNRNWIDYSEKFNVVYAENGMYSIKTIDGETLKCINNGANIIANSGADGIDKFEITSLSKKIN